MVVDCVCAGKARSGEVRQLEINDEILKKALQNTVKLIDNYAFYGCSNLTTIYVGTNTSTVCTLSNTNAFNRCTSLTNIYVPASLVNSYKSATNWSNYADKIKAAP